MIVNVIRKEKRSCVPDLTKSEWDIIHSSLEEGDFIATVIDASSRLPHDYFEIRARVEELCKSKDNIDKFSTMDWEIVKLCCDHPVLFTRDLTPTQKMLYGKAAKKLEQKFNIMVPR